MLLLIFHPRSGCAHRGELLGRLRGGCLGGPPLLHALLRSLLAPARLHHCHAQLHDACVQGLKGSRVRRCGTSWGNLAPDWRLWGQPPPLSVSQGRSATLADHTVRG